MPRPSHQKKDLAKMEVEFRTSLPEKVVDLDLPKEKKKWPYGFTMKYAMGKTRQLRFVAHK